MADDRLRDQVAKAVCAMTTGAERTDAVMHIIQEHTEAETQRLQYLVDEFGKREASQDRIRRQLTQERDAWRDRANRAAAKLAKIRALAESTDRGVGYRVSGDPDTWGPYYEGRHDLGGEIETILDAEPLDQAHQQRHQGGTP